MKKPIHKQEWRDIGGPCGGRIVNEHGDVIADEVEESAGPIVAAAPDMARALLGELDPDGHVIACGNGGDDPCDCSPRCQRVTDALRKAGLLS